MQRLPIPKGKAGLAWQFLVLIVISMILLIVLMPFFFKFFKGIESKTPKDICKTSVYANSVLRIKDVEFSRSLDCETELITLDDGDPDAIKARFAKAMFDCWDQFGQGKLQLFAGSGTFCVVCSHIVFEGAARGTRVNGFSEYLLTETIPGRQVTYMDHLLGFETPRASEFYGNPGVFNAAQAGGTQEIDTRKDYGVLFLYGRGQSAIDNLKTALGGSGGAAAAAGVAGGAVGGAFAVLVLGSNPVGWVTGGLILVGFGAASIYTFFAGEEPEWMALTHLTEFTPENLERLECDVLPVPERKVKL